MTVKGEYINYSLSVLSNSVNKDDAINFVSFLLGRQGIDIFRKNGQEPIIPFSTKQPELIPEKLKEYLIAGNPDR
jgi:ABC-type Fe3+ transport system substrate-binding protein